MVPLLSYSRQVSKRLLQWGFIVFLLTLIGFFSIPATFAAPNDLTLTLLSTSETDVGGNPNNVFIGEVMTYQLVYEVSEGTNTNAVITVILPVGLEYISASATSAVANDNGWNASMTVTGGGSSGADVNFNFGTINNTDVDANAETITIRFKAIANNRVSNQTGTSLSVNTQLSINSTLISTSNNVTVNIIEPNLSIVSYTITSPTGLLATASPSTDAGDTYNYRISFTNTGTAPAYDIILSIILPLTYVYETTGTYTLSGAATCGGASLVGIDPVIVTVPCLNPGATLNIQVNVTVQNTVQPLDSWLSSASLTNYASLPDENGSNDDVPGAYGTATGARTGAEGIGGVLNNYATSATNSPSLTVPGYFIAFDSATSSASEAIGIGNILRITTSSGGATTSPVTVGIGVTGGSATAPDYTLGGTITIPSGTANNSLFSVASGFSVNNDNLVEADETVVLQLSAPSSGALLGAQTTHTHTIQNDDTTTLTINDNVIVEGNTGTSTLNFAVISSTAVEGGFTVAYTLTDGTATIANNDYVATGSSLIFTGTAGETQTIPVTINGDRDIELDETFTVSLGAISGTIIGQSNFVRSDTATGTINNDDIAGITVTPTTIAITEGGATATFEVVAQANPSSSISIPVTTDGQCTVSVNPVVLSAGNITPVTVTVTAVDDLDIEGTHSCLISLGDPSSGDANFDALNDVVDVTATVTDNDIAGIIVTPTTIAIAEGGATATFSLASSTNTTAIVNIPLTTDGQCLLSSVANPIPSTSLIAALPAGSSTSITITVEAVDDNVEESTHNCVITTSDPISLDVNYNNLNSGDVADVLAIVTDNDSAGVSLSAITITEGNAGVPMDVVLSSEPTGDVTLTFTPDVQCTLSTTTLTFTGSLGATPWDVVQQVTVTAVDDAVQEGAHTCVISYTATSSDANYTLASIDHNIAVIDNDSAGVSLSAITITEGTTGVPMDVVLSSEPTGDVTLTFTPDAQCTLSTTTLTFTDSVGATPWNVVQQVTVIAVDDVVQEGAHTCVISYTATSSDANYTLPSTDHNVAVIDNDTAGVSLSAITITEGNAGVPMDVVLSSEPTGDVTLTFTPDVQCTLSTTTLTFTGSLGATPWDVVQQVTVTAVDDAVQEGAHTCVISYTATSSDANYTLASIDHNIAVIDNDSAGVSLSAITITEGTTGVPMDVVLSSEPTGDVTLTFTPDAQCTLSTPILTFTGSLGATPWNVVQQVTVTAVDDAVEEGAHTCVISYTATSSDTNYTLPSTDHNIAVIDNDSAGVSLSAITITEGTAGVPMDVVLFSEPTDAVTLTFTPDAQCTLNPMSLIFTDSAGATPWNSAQQIVVTAVDDLLVEASQHDCMLSVTVTSTDLNYSGLTITHSLIVYDKDSEVSPGIPAETFLCGNLRQQTNGVMMGNGDIGNIEGNEVFGNTYCSVIALNSEFLRNPAEIGNKFILDQGVVQALDVYGLLPGGVSVVPFETPVHICLMGSGSIYFLSSFGGSPPPVQLTPLLSSSPNYTCVSVPNAGKVVLVNTPSTLQPQPLPPVQTTSTLLTQGACEITTTFAVRLRAMPDTSSDIIATLPFDLTLVATEYSSGWYRVIYLDGQGWINEQYLSTTGDC